MSVSAAPTPVSIGEMLDRLGRLARALQFAHGLNPTQWEALRFIARANRYSRSPGALAAFLGATKGTVSQTLITLEERGFITRSPGGKDRRSIRLGLSEKGAAILAQDPTRAIDAAMDDLPTDARAALMAGMDALLASLQRRGDRKVFGVCRGCVHFETDAAMPAACRCGLMLEPLASGEELQLCVTFEAAQA
ncbi:MAG: MarR family transcriptional regulator [Alphaproteobacteria bacterium]|nr:MarR family transcriptional regulator [Alphaproteobacteria bacterium]